MPTAKRVTVNLNPSEYLKLQNLCSSSNCSLSQAFKNLLSNNVVVSEPTFKIIKDPDIVEEAVNDLFEVLLG